MGIFGYGRNNSLFVSLSDMWAWGPEQIHCFLGEHFLKSSGDTRLAWERSFLHPTSPKDLTTLDREFRCINSLWEGDRIPIDLFTSFLNANPRKAP